MNCILKSSVLSVLAACMVACSGAPSEGDIKAALNAELARLAAGNPFAAAMEMKLEGVERLGCEEAGEASYLCDVRVKASSLMSGETTTARQLRLAKSGGEWVVMQ